MAVALTAGQLLYGSPFNYNAAYTVTGWVYVPTVPGATDSNVVYVGDDDGTSPFVDTNHDALFYNHASSRVNVEVEIATAFPVATAINPIMRAGVWYHFALVRNSVTGVTAYMEPYIRTGAHSTVASRTAAAVLMFGVSGNVDLRFRGIKIWSGRALTEAQLRAEWVDPDRVVDTANIWAWYRLQNASDLADASGQGHGPLVFSGTAIADAADPEFFAAMIANANAVVTTGWTSPTNAYAAEAAAAYATAAPATNVSVSSDYGFPAFDSGVIPDGSKIVSVEAEIQDKSSTTASTGATIGVQVNNNGTLLGAEQTQGMSTTDQQLRHLVTPAAMSLALEHLRTANQMKARIAGKRAGSATAITWSLNYVVLRAVYVPPAAPSPVLQAVNRAGTF